MWEFIKSAPWTCAIGALIFIIAIAGVIWGLVGQYDRGFMKRNGRTLQWDKSDIPLKIKYTSRIHATYLELVKFCIATLNSKLGKPIFDHKIGFFDDKDDLSKVHVLLDKLDTVGENTGGRTDVYDTTNAGRIVVAKIFMPDPDLKWPEDAVLTHLRHEMGHALGLDHDDKTDSVMHQDSERRAKDFTASDLERLRKAYL